jgi:FMN phosphatase YigB (HAD superfamily)
MSPLRIALSCRRQSAHWVVSVSALARPGGLPLAVTVDSLQAIREQGIKVVLATDNMDAFCRWTVPAMHLGGIFDAILDSASLGVLKDDLVGGRSPFFGPWLSDQRIAPSEAVLVDDSPPASAASAAAIGLETRLVEHPGKLASVLTQLDLARGTGGSAATSA